MPLEETFSYTEIIDEGWEHLVAPYKQFRLNIICFNVRDSFGRDRQ